jgi:hypothetical protein
LLEPLMKREWTLLVTEVGFIDHPWITNSGASPDGLAAEGMVETQMPKYRHAHCRRLLDRKTVPEKYITQMMWQMACADRPWCDFVSFDPRLSEKYISYSSSASTMTLKWLICLRIQSSSSWVM